MNNMKFSLRQKIILPLIVCGLLMAGYIYIVPYQQSIENKKKDVSKSLYTNLKYLAIPITTALLENDLSNVYEIMNATLSENPGWKSIQIYDSTGVMIYPLKNEINITANSKQYKVYKKNIVYQGSELGNILLHADIKFYLTEHLVFINKLLYANFIVFIIFVIVVSIIVDYMIRKPVTNLAKVASQLANGNYDTVLPTSSNDELGELIDRFDQMRHSLNESNLELENQKHSLDMHSMVCMVDEDQQITYVNEKWCVIGAYKKTDVISKDMFSFVDKTTKPNIRQEIMSVVNAGNVWSGQLTNIKKNGLLYYTEATIVPFMDENKKLYKLINIQTDISIQIYTENMLRETSERINHLLKYSSTVIYSRSLSNNLEINFISENLLNITGYDNYDVLNDELFFESHIHPDDLPKFKQHLHTMKRDSLDSVEYRFKHSDGHYMWVIDKHRVVYDKFGKQVDIVGSLGDITERITVQNDIEFQVKQQAAVSSLGQFALKNNEIDKLFTKTVKVLSGLLNVDLCLVLKLDLNEDVFTIQTVEGHEGQISTDLKIPADTSTHAGQTLETNSEVLIEDLASDTRFVKPNFLTKLGLSSGITIPIPGRNDLYGVLCVYSNEHRLFTYDDVQFIRSVANILGLSVERKTFQDELIGYQEHLVEMVDEQTQDLIVARDAALVAERSMSTFLSNMSHELRTPLHGILSFARFGIKKYETASKEKLYDYFTEIFDSGETLLTLVSTLLDLSKLKAGKMIYDYQSDDIIPLAKKVIKEYSALCIEKNIEINYQHNSDSVLCEIDSEKISQVIRNLLSNAFKFSDNGSSIDLCVEQNEGFLNVSVSDKGVGIPENEVESIFKPFTQSSLTRTKAGGTGLGLSICKEIIESGHHGNISATSKEGEGTRFIFTLPLLLSNSSNQYAKLN